MTLTIRPRVSVIVPTFREADNLWLLVPRIHMAMRQAGISEEILIVDDDSPDDTVEVCAQLIRRFPIKLMVRKGERGLGSAVVHGMKGARGKIFVVMDADLSHPPEMIPQLIAELDQPGIDFVIGSRYVAGGGIEQDWGLFRWLNSKVATLLARPFTNVTDPMAGFFALHAETFRRAQTLDPIGYKIGLELIVKCACKKIREVPISFRNRIHGESKLTLREQINYLKHLAKLAAFKLKKNHGQPVKMVIADSPIKNLSKAA
ncbi:MAG: polyprenol monophosphomannose synthase [Planctomycetota bacterium]